MGFLTLQSSLQHGDFNRIHHPDVNNLAEDRVELVTWWTPGQYLVPHWVARALGTDIGTALRIVAFGASMAGLAGCALLFTKLGFSRRCVVLSLVVIGTQDYFLKSSRVYLGGDLLLFAAAPYLALGVLARGVAFHWRAVIAGLAGFCALLLKASAVTLFLALAFYLAIEAYGWPGRREAPRRDWGVVLRRGLILAGVVALYALAMQVVYLSKGETIGASAGSEGLVTPGRLWGLFVALGGPLYGAFALLEPYSTRTFFIPMAVLCVLAVRHLACGAVTEDLPDYRRMLVAYYLAFALFFAGVYVVGMSVSPEPRHFRFAGLLLLPGLLHWLLAHRYQGIMTWGLVLLSFTSVVFHHWENASRSAVPDSASRWGIRQPVSNESLAAMHEVDRTLVKANTIVFNAFGACPALLLEFNNGRKLQDDNWIFQGFNYKGRSGTPVPWYRQSADSIVLLVPKNTRWYFGPSLPEIARTFARPLQVTPCYENSELTIYLGRVR